MNFLQKPAIQKFRFFASKVMWIPNSGWPVAIDCPAPDLYLFMTDLWLFWLLDVCFAIERCQYFFPFLQKSSFLIIPIFFPHSLDLQNYFIFVRLI